MALMQNPQWLRWARRFQALAQIGLTYCKDPYDRQRYEEIQRLAAEITAKSAGLPDAAPLVERFEQDVGYATPKIDMRTAVLIGIATCLSGSAMMASGRYPAAGGTWAIPPGRQPRA